MNGEPPLDEIDAIGAALDDDDPERALDLALRALRDAEEPDALLHFFAGRALLDLDRPEAALAHLERAARLDPEDLEFLADLALARFRTCRFDEARADVERLLDLDADRPDSHELAALLAEREGRFEEADRRFAAAEALDPERFPAPVRMTRAAFEDVVRDAEARLPETFRARLAEVAVTCEDVPATEILTESEPPYDAAELLGLFVGTSLPERSHLGTGGDLPPRILLFQRNLERFASDAEDLEEQIAITLYHELGHYLGLDEDELERIDLA